ncbi:MAG TPA: c-type cytochrome [Gemmatimonadaceae bacterium]|jgi:cytochrome c2
MRSIPRVVAVAIAVLGAITACSARSSVPEQVVVNGNATRGKAAIDKYGCGACHSIPGIQGATGMVGPPLEHWSERRIIAGEVANTPDRLVAWIMAPQTIEPGNAMPNMGIGDGDARDIAAYLYSIR